MDTQGERKNHSNQAIYSTSQTNTELPCLHQNPKELARFHHVLHAFDECPRTLIYLLNSPIPPRLVTHPEATSSNESWPGVEYNEVRAFAWTREGLASIAKDGMWYDLVRDDTTIAPNSIHPEGTKLTPPQVQRLLFALTGPHPEQYPMRCFVPRSAVAFYDSNQKVVAAVAICFSCLLSSGIPQITKHIDYLALAALFDELKLPVGQKESFEAYKQEYERFITR